MHLISSLLVWMQDINVMRLSYMCSIFIYTSFLIDNVDILNNRR